MGDFCQYLYEILASKLVQLTTIQSGCCSTSTCLTGAGMTVASGWVCGTCAQKRGSLSRETASAAPFCEPGICCPTKTTLNLARKKTRHLNKCMAHSTELFPELRMATAATLSIVLKLIFITIFTYDRIYKMLWHEHGI